MDGKTLDGLNRDAMCGEDRRTARQMLYDRARCLRVEAARLEELADALPAKLPGPADVALQDLVINANVASAHST